MLKSKKCHRLLGSMLSFGLLTSTLPASIPLNAQPQQTEVEQKIKQIKSVTTRLIFAKIAAPSLLVGAAAAGFLAVAAAVIAALFLIPRLRLKKSIQTISKKLEGSEFLKKMKTQIVKNFVMDKEINLERLEQHVKDINKEAIEKLPKLKKMAADFSKKVTDAHKNLLQKIYTIKIEKALPSKIKREIANLAKKTNIDLLTAKTQVMKQYVKDIGPDIKKAIEEFYNEASKNPIRRPLQPKLKKLGAAAAISGIGAVLLGLGGTAMASVGIYFGLTPKSVAAAFDNVKKLQQIAQDNPGIMTPQQKRVIANFKKQLKNKTVQGIVKNLRLKGALDKLVDTAIKNNPSFVVPRGKETKEAKEKKMRKVFADYIKARRQEKLFQKAADAYATMNISGFKAFTTRFQLNKKKKKIAKLQASSPGIRAALEPAVQKYSEQADTMLEEIKEELMKAVETKEFEQEMQKMQQQPIVPL